MSCVTIPFPHDPYDRHQRSGVKPQLSDREIEVLLEWLRRDSKAAAARALHIATSTVNTHVQRVRGKYAEVGRPANSKVAMAVRAVQDGLVTLEELCPPDETDQ